MAEGPDLRAIREPLPPSAERLLNDIRWSNLAATPEWSEFEESVHGMVWDALPEIVAEVREAERADRERLRSVIEAAKSVVDAYVMGRSDVAMRHAIKGLVGEWTDCDHPLVRHDP